MRDLLRIMQRLRDPGARVPLGSGAGFFQSIVPSTLEECYELAAAIEAGDYAHLADELGDLLFQVVFLCAARRASEALFSFRSTSWTAWPTKLLRRHPHVFADGEIEGVVEGHVRQRYA
jgi:ATP diphosphatase